MVALLRHHQAVGPEGAVLEAVDPVEEEAQEEAARVAVEEEEEEVLAMAVRLKLHSLAQRHWPYTAWVPYS